MAHHLKVLLVDASSSFYRVDRYPLGDFFGPVDLGLHLAGRLDSLNIGTGLLAGSIIPGSNRLVFSGFSPCWGGFFVSSMGGAGLVFHNLGIDLLAIVGTACSPSVLVLNRSHGEEVEVTFDPVDAPSVWGGGRGGVYAMMDHVFERFGDRYENDPRILAVGPAAAATDFGAICSAPIVKGELTHVDTWAGRGGLGTKLYRRHGIAAVCYGGTHIEEDFRDRAVADRWFVDAYEKKLAAKDFESTTKYRFDPSFKTGGTFGVNFATIGGRMLAFNYRSVFMGEQERVDLHERLVLGHYLAQFNQETIEPKEQKTCGEPCAAVCKKMHGIYKKDYEPYQTMGPLAGVFDQRAAEMLNHRADSYGFDAISAGGVVSWLMECCADGLFTPEELGIPAAPVFSPDGFDVVADSMRNAEIGVALLDGIIGKRGILDLSEGARKFGRRLSRVKGQGVLDRFVYTAFGRRGWMVPNQYWTPGALSPMAIMGKYYMYYGADFAPPRVLGRICAERFRTELVMDNLGICRFHRGWAEEMLPEIVERLFEMKDAFLGNVAMTASRINSRNAGVYWESERSLDFVYSFLRRKRDVDGETAPELGHWLDRFEKNKQEAGLDFWYEMHKGIQESLREF
ncbi:MAG: aldehyde ferredoxin oxidoreductase [Candidatus Krumholzibacteriota bacterium]|nr:aldehyde ferredoxin oxidoreductase [Candidatus Krumholzibacteriota bacterium]